VPNALQPSEDGFLESPKSNAFSALDKQRWLKTFQETENVNVACDAAVICLKTFYNHLHNDPAFKEEYTLLTKRIAFDIQSAFSHQGKKPKGFMQGMATLRAYMPELYDRQGLQNMAQTNSELVINVSKAMDAQIVKD
jgi:hypothetical protein